MSFHKGKRTIGIGMMLVLTTFAYSAANVSAQDEPIIAEAGGPYFGEECFSVPFDASGSYAPVGITLQYRWDFNGTWTDWSLSAYWEFTWRTIFHGFITLEVWAVETNLTAFDTAEVTVNNTAPFITGIDGPMSPVYVGDTVPVTVHFYDGNPREHMTSLDTFTVTYYWGDNDSSVYHAGFGEFNITMSHVYALPGYYDVFITIFDNNGGDTSGDFYITVIEPPVQNSTIDAGPDGFINEGSLFTSNGSFISSESGPFTATVDYGDGSGPQPLSLSPGYLFDLSHRYIQNGLYTVLVTVFKNCTAYGSDSALVTVINVPPTAMLVNDGPKDEGSPVTISFTNQYDPGILDTFTYCFDWNYDGVYEIIDQLSTSGQYTWYDNGIYTVKAMIKDEDGGFSEYTTDVIVNNVPPTITSLSVSPTSSNCSGFKVGLVGVFTDPGILDSHVALIEWGDNQTAIINLPAGIYDVNQSHIYARAGAYTITLTVIDNDGGFDSKSIDIMIYKPYYGCHHGCGWEKFTFYSKCKKEYTSPCGYTEFWYHLTHLNGYSHLYGWLSNIGKKVTCKGVYHLW